MMLALWSYQRPGGGRGWWLRVGGGSEARTPVPALLVPRRVLQSAFTPSPAPAQVSLGSASLSYTCCFRGHAFPLSLQLSPPPPLSSSPLACDSQSPTHTSVPPPTHARTHTHTPSWAPSLSPSRGLTKEANPSNHGSLLPTAQLTLAKANIFISTECTEAETWSTDLSRKDFKNGELFIREAWWGRCLSPVSKEKSMVTAETAGNSFPPGTIFFVCNSASLEKNKKPLYRAGLAVTVTQSGVFR